MGRSVTSCAARLCLVLGATTFSFASPVTFTDETEFHNALGNVTLHIESFEGGPQNATQLSFPTVNLQCTTPDGCNATLETSTLLPTDGDQGVHFGADDTITIRWDRPVTAFGLDVSDLGTNGASDLILIINGVTIYILNNYSDVPGGTVFIGAIDPQGILTVRVTAQRSDPNNTPDEIYVDRLQTLPAGPGLGGRRWNTYGIYGGERAPDFDLEEVEEAAETPEPSATWLMLAGLGALGAGRKLRHR